MKKILFQITPFTLGVVLFFVLWGLKIVDQTMALLFAFLVELLLLGHILLHRIERVSASVDDVANVRGLAKVPDHIRQAKQQQHRFSPRLVDGMVQSFSANMAQLSQGRQRLSPDRFMELAELIYQDLRHGDTLIATSYFAGGDYWKERYGAEYARLNQEAHARGATIQRVFVLRDAQHLAEKRDILVAQQQFADVHVCVLSDSPLPLEEQRDFFVINDELAAEFHFSPSQVLLSVELICDEAEITRLKGLISRILARRAKRFEG